MQFPDWMHTCGLFNKIPLLSHIADRLHIEHTRHFDYGTCARREEKHENQENKLGNTEEIPTSNIYSCSRR